MWVFINPFELGQLGKLPGSVQILEKHIRVATFCKEIRIWTTPVKVQCDTFTFYCHHNRSQQIQWFKTTHCMKYRPIGQTPGPLGYSQGVSRVTLFSRLLAFSSFEEWLRIFGSQPLPPSWKWPKSFVWLRFSCQTSFSGLTWEKFFAVNNSKDSIRLTGMDIPG